MADIFVKWCMFCLVGLLLLTAIVFSERKGVTVTGLMFVNSECEGSQRGWEEQNDNFERSRLSVSKRQSYVAAS
jgi:hypothetical protein